MDMGSEFSPAFPHRASIKRDKSIVCSVILVYTYGSRRL